MDEINNVIFNFLKYCNFIVSRIIYLKLNHFIYLHNKIICFIFVRYKINYYVLT